MRGALLLGTGFCRLTTTPSGTFRRSSWTVCPCSPRLLWPPHQRSTLASTSILSSFVSPPSDASSHQHSSGKGFSWTCHHYLPYLSSWKVWISRFLWIFGFLVVLVTFIFFFSQLVLSRILHTDVSRFSFQLLFSSRFMLVSSQVHRFESSIFRFSCSWLDLVWMPAVYRVIIFVGSFHWSGLVVFS